ncbi:sensor histidine kinase [Olleya aquimaris]|uniref:histidine kinase n=1 Tax=Olleya aquimaris TaxID=639310 RepID=A0A327RQP6_9FLAO|nr:HAMP domain-containing sensor histidine kinase [Olleya aquimaris]RAJ17984.1 HAMP domain-containing protein [Olleya aquimaris]
MKITKLSLRLRIFFAMIFLVLLASILIALVAAYQYSEETQDYHQQRLERKEKNIKRHLDFVIRETTFEVIPEKLPLIFKDEIYKIADIHGLKVNLYDLEGTLLISSKASLPQDTVETCIRAEILNKLSNTSGHKYVELREEKGENFRSSYTYITDTKFKPLAILNLPYLENDDFLSRELNEFFERLGYTYILMLITAIALAYFLSKYITRTLKTISDKMNQTRLEKRNQKIEIESTTEEISTLVKSYNSMIDQLEESAVKLAKSEREQAWREMAKQVAHEIKNPLTPMRLTVQSFQRKFDPQDPNIVQKLDEYSKTLIQQIDTMSSIASAFSNFAKMPAQQNETLNVVKIIDLALDIFNEDYIIFQPEKEEIIAKFDRTQLIRVVTNLVKNAIQAIPEDKTPNLIVTVSEKDNDVIITISDNGKGITDENKPKVFEPKFTTKSSGMGLGLAMVKNIVETYQGTITFVSEEGKGTTFTVSFPKQ